MPRERVFEKLPDSDSMRDHRRITVKIGDNDDGSPKTDTAEYWVPNSGVNFKNWVAQLNGTDLDDAWQKHIAATDAEARQSVRESVTADTTVIMVNGQRIDIMEYPTTKLLFAINSFAGVAYSTGKDMPNAFATARKRLLANGKDGQSFNEIDNPAGEGPKLLALVK